MHHRDMTVGVWSLTCRVFDQDVQLLVHFHLEGTVLGVLGLVGVDAAVGVSDKRAGDAAARLPNPVNPPAEALFREVVRQQERGAARDEVAAAFETSEPPEWFANSTHTHAILR